MAIHRNNNQVKLSIVYKGREEVYKIRAADEMKKKSFLFFANMRMDYL